MTAKSKPSITVPDILKRKSGREKISALTAYDFPTAKILDNAGIDLILVGDSLGMVVLGYSNTIPVTMDVMIHHTRAVSRGAQRALVIGDMPFFSCNVSLDEAKKNACRFIQEGGAGGVKIEGSSPRRLELIASLVEADIPVMGHVGLTPQSIHHLGRFQVIGKNPREAREILAQARDLERAGVFAVVLECIPREIAAEVTKKLNIPTIGIGAGPHCDGQILVFHDLAGYSHGYLPKFVKQYARLNDVIEEAAQNYIQDVKKGVFPEDKHSYHLKKPGRLGEFFNHEKE
ncbi:MAG: 3-methyl-2-oxobutanoate hydroxymethyltransferase [Candidatus Aminicenantaceae bacterium]